MLTEYESYLSEALEKCQEQLKKAQEELGYRQFKIERTEKELENYRKLWRDSFERCDEFEKQIEEMKKEKEQDATTSNSSDNLKEAV
jgi:chromosome segregation ATPase